MLLSNYFASVYRYAGAVLFILLLNAALHAQITPSADAYIDTTKPTTNYGSAVTLGVVSPSQTTYITFDLSSIPSGYTGSNIAKASLKLYVNTLPKAGSFNGRSTPRPRAASTWAATPSRLARMQTITRLSDLPETPQQLVCRTPPSAQVR